MHEVSICESILDIVREQAAMHGSGRVRSVRLAIGEMSGVVEDSMRFAFEVVSKGTVADGAELLIDIMPLMAMCRGCGGEFPVKGYAFTCAHCGGPDIEITSGREMTVEELDLE